MTGRRNDALTRWVAAAIAALLLLGALVSSACSLDPDAGASISVGKEYAPTPVKLSVIESMKAQGFTLSRYISTYVVYPSLSNTSAVLVTGLMYGPSSQPGVLDIYKALRLSLEKDGVWKVVEATKGTPAPEPGASEEGSGEAGAAAESSAAVESSGTTPPAQ